MCQVPSSVSIANGAAAPFTVTVSTSGGASLPPLTLMRFFPDPAVRLLVLLWVVLLLIPAAKNRCMSAKVFKPMRLVWSGALAAILLCSVIYAAGCGGGSSPPPAISPTPPPGVVTPAGTSMIIITPTAMSLTGQPLQLTPIQLTLTVN
jgi:hypothetical protein